MSVKSRVLFICTHNSARSQMAEGLLRARAGDRFEVASAGTQPGEVRPLAVQVVAEAGIDISSHRVTSAESYVQDEFDFVITVCDDANETCPVFPHAQQRLHWSFPDPSRAEGTLDERLAVFRRVRDAIAARVDEFVASTTNGGGSPA